MDNKEKKAVSLLDQLIDSTSKVLDAAKKPFIRKKVKRGFESAIDNAEEEITTKELELIEMRTLLITKPLQIGDTINDLTTLKGDIDNLRFTIRLLKEEQNTLLIIEK